MKKIVTLLPLTAEDRAFLRARMPSAEFIFSSPKEITCEEIIQANGIIGNAPAAWVKQNTENLEWMQLNSAGADAYLKQGVIRPDAVLTNATGAYGLAVSEHMFAMTLMLMKNMDRYCENQHQSIWRDEGDVSSFFGAHTLILGLGDIGREYALRAKAFGSYVVGITRTGGQKRPEWVDESDTVEHLDAHLPKADVVAMFLPGTTETRHIISGHTLSLMKKSAILVNGGRGTAIDQDALIDALEHGKLRGAALDVTDPEPLPAEHKLWHTKNVLITPHVSGQYHLSETLKRIVKIAGRNLKAYADGTPFENVVDFETGYRKLTPGGKG